MKDASDNFLGRLTLSTLASFLRYLAGASFLLSVFIFLLEITAWHRQLTLEIVASISRGKHLEVYLNNDFEHPLRMDIFPGRFHTYVIENLPLELTNIRIDPTDFEQEHVEFKSITVFSGLHPLLTLSTSDDKAWAFSGLTREAAGAFLTSSADPQLNLKTGPIVLRQGAVNFFLKRVANYGFTFPVILLILLGCAFLILALQFDSSFQFFPEDSPSEKCFLALLVVLVSIGAFVLNQQFPPISSDLFMPEVFQSEGFNTQAQLYAHRAVLVALSFFCLLIYFLPRLLKAPRLLTGHFHPSAWKALSALASIPLIFFLMYLFAFSTTENFISIQEFIVLGILLTLLSYCACSEGIFSPRLSLFLCLCLIFYTILSNLQGWFLYPAHLHMKPTELSFIEGHYSLMVGAAGRLARNERAFTDIRFWYGLLLPSIFSLIERARGAFQIHDYVRTIQAFNLCFLLLGVFSYWKYYLADGRQRKVEFTLALLLLLPFVSTLAYEPTLYPNLSAWRHLNFAIGTVLLLATRNLTPLLRAILYGLMSGVLLTLNMETGISMLVGLATFMLLEDFTSISNGFIRFVVFVLACCCSIALVFFAFVSFVQDTSLIHFMSYFRPQAGGLGAGIGGRVFRVTPCSVFGLIIFLQAILEIFRSFAVLSREPVETFAQYLQHFRAALGATVVVWFAYFANRPVNFWILWTYIYLFGFFLEEYWLDSMRFLREVVACLTFRFNKMRHLILPLSGWSQLRAIIFLFAVLPLLLTRNFEMFSKPQAPGEDLEDQFSSEPAGIGLENKFAQSLSEKIAFVRSTAERSSFIYLTANTFTISQITGISQNLPLQDPYVETMRVIDYERLLARIKELRPERILIEDERSAFMFNDEQVSFFNHLKNDLVGRLGYKMRGTEHGWEILGVEPFNADQSM